jgi:hypothetical protein
MIRIISSIINEFIKDPFYSIVDLFDMEMKCLPDNRFKVLTMSNLKYDGENNIIYILK